MMWTTISKDMLCPSASSAEARSTIFVFAHATPCKRPFAEPRHASSRMIVEYMSNNDFDWRLIAALMPPKGGDDSAPPRRRRTEGVLLYCLRSPSPRQCRAHPAERQVNNCACNFSYALESMSCAPGIDDHAWYTNGDLAVAPNLGVGRAAPEGHGAPPNKLALCYGWAASGPLFMYAFGQDRPQCRVVSSTETSFCLRQEVHPEPGTSRIKRGIPRPRNLHRPAPAPRRARARAPMPKCEPGPRQVVDVEVVLRAAAALDDGELVVP